MKQKRERRAIMKANLKNRSRRNFLKMKSLRRRRLDRMAVISWSRLSAVKAHLHDPHSHSNTFISVIFCINFLLVCIWRNAKNCFIWIFFFVCSMIYGTVNGHWRDIFFKNFYHFFCCLSFWVVSSFRFFVIISVSSFFFFLNSDLQKVSCLHRFSSSSSLVTYILSSLIV